MTRRITLTMLVAILLSVFVAGSTVALVTAVGARTNTRRDLVSQAVRIRANLGVAPGNALGEARVRLARAAACRNLAQAVVRPDGTVRPKAEVGDLPLPPLMNTDKLGAGGIDSGTHRRVVLRRVCVPAGRTEVR